MRAKLCALSMLAVIFVVSAPTIWFCTTYTINQVRIVGLSTVEPDALLEVMDIQPGGLLIHSTKTIAENLNHSGFMTVRSVSFINNTLEIRAD